MTGPIIIDMTPEIDSMIESLKQARTLRNERDAARAVRNQALDIAVLALQRAQAAERERDRLAGLLRRFVDGINDEWHPLFVSAVVLTDDERTLLEDAEAMLREMEGEK